MSKEATTVKTTIPVNICHPGADVQIRSVTNVWKCTKCGGVLVKVPRKTSQPLTDRRSRTSYPYFLRRGRTEVPVNGMATGKVGRYYEEAFR